MDTLYLWQMGVVGAIHGGLMLGLLWLNRYYKVTPFFLLGTWWQPLSIQISLALLTGVVSMAINMMVLEYAARMTLLVVNAGLLTLWYLELGILLGRKFFARLFDDELPKEISIFIAFVLVTNGGYFTLMLIKALFRADTL